MKNYDLASLTKPLITAPLALSSLNLDEDYTSVLGFNDSTYRLTPRALLSHSSGLPPWLPFNETPLSTLLESDIPWGMHPLLRKAPEKLACYSDLNYRLLGELVALFADEDYLSLAQKHSILKPFPWTPGCIEIPPGPDHEAWQCIDPRVSIPPYNTSLPHDINARAGMRGHAGFAANPDEFKKSINYWIEEKFPQRMSREPIHGENGSLWGLGLQKLRTGTGSLGDLLSRIPLGALSEPLVIEGSSDHLSIDVDQSHTGDCAWWGHLAFTGPAIFYRPEDQACIGLLTHRKGPQGELLTQPQIHARRIELLGRAVESL